MSSRSFSVYALGLLLILTPILVFVGYGTFSSPSLRDTVGITLEKANDIVPGDYASGYVRFLLPKNSRAKCLDGSSPAYYVRHGSGSGTNKWIVLFEGGGWCYDLEQCYLRSKTVLGSSRDYPDYISRDKMDFYISENETVNPQMHNWNTVLVKYCDGGSYASDAETRYNDKTLYFHGKANRDETIRSLFSLPSHRHFKTLINTVPTELISRGGNMSSADEIVIAGCSAGALGVLLGIDQIAKLIRSTAAKYGNNKVIVRGLVDSGFFMNYSSTFEAKETHNWYGKDDAVTATTRRINGNNNMDYAIAMRDIFDFMNISAGANPACLSRHSINSLRTYGEFSPHSDCIFAVNLIPHLETPVFLLQPQYDQWQILHIFSQAYTSAQVNGYGHSLVTTLRSTLFHAKHPGHGAFVDSCSHHCTSCSDSTENTWSGTHIHTTTNEFNSSSGNNSIINNNAAKGAWNEAMAFRIWYEESVKVGAQSGALATTGKNWFFQDKEYPCHGCCLCSVDMLAQFKLARQQ